MGDHVEVLAAIDRIPDVRYSTLTPNAQGMNKVVSLGSKGVNEVAIFSAASETFSKKNINCSIETSLQRFDEVLEIARGKNLPVRGYVSCVVGCPYEGKITPSQVVPVVKKLLDMGCMSSFHSFLFFKFYLNSMKSHLVIPLALVYRSLFNNYFKLSMQVVFLRTN
jgi:hydroxymethylglutaryl-CoA lyase